MVLKAWNVGIDEYCDLSPQVSFYRESTRAMVELARVHDDMTVVDLACGSSCLVTKRLVSLRHPPRRIYCVDPVAASLRRAAKHLPPEGLRFVATTAEDVSDAIHETVDSVLCNSAFFLFELPRVLVSIRRLLSQGGTFLFGFGGWHLPKKETHPKYKAIADELAGRGLPPKRTQGAPERWTLDALDEMLGSHNFSVHERRRLEIPTSVEDWMRFYSIPSLASLSLPDLEVDKAVEVLKAAMLRLRPWDKLPPVEWIIYKTQATGLAGDPWTPP